MKNKSYYNLFPRFQGIKQTTFEIVKHKFEFASDSLTTFNVALN